MRFFVGGISTETNTFSPIPTGWGAFEGRIHRGGTAAAELRDSFRMLSEEARAPGWEVTFGLLADCPPGAPVSQAVYESLRDELLADMEAALPVDIVLLDLHGGMVAYGYDDCEGDLLTRVRSLVGPDVVVGARLDPHCHLTEAMTDNATLVVCYKENPHTDIAARGDDLVRLAVATAEGRVTPVMSVFDCRMADVFQTNREPMRAYVDKLRAMEGRDGVLDISIAHGFRRADIPYMGTKVIAITDGIAEHGARLAREIGHELFAMRGTCSAPYTDLEAAVEAAVSAGKGPVLLADLADNPGGGSPGDSTYILNSVLAQGCRNVAVGYMVDPLALQFAQEAGVGATLPMRIGGKACSLSGDPLDLEVTVRGLVADGVLEFGSNSRMSVGPVAWLQQGDLDLVIIGQRVQTYTPDLFNAFGIDLSGKQVIVVKSAQHYRAWFKDIFAEEFVIDGPGVCTPDIMRMTFNRISRPMWPFDPDPLGILAA